MSETPEPTQEQRPTCEICMREKADPTETVGCYAHSSEAWAVNECSRLGLERLAAEAAPLRAEIERLTKERDEAREAATDWLDKYRKASDRRVEVEAESLAAASRAREEQGALRAAAIEVRADMNPSNLQYEVHYLRQFIESWARKIDAALAPPAAESQENQQQLTGKGGG